MLAEMEEEEGEEGAEVGDDASSAMRPSPSALMLAAGLISAQDTLRDRADHEHADDRHPGPSTELQAG